MNPFGQKSNKAYSKQALKRISSWSSSLTRPINPSISASSSILCAYPNHISRDGQRPLETLSSFLDSRYSSAFDSLHLLPFFPATGDGGFAVSDYNAVASNLGTWTDIHLLASRFAMIVDLVLNHVSSEHEWFRQYLQGSSRSDFFIEVPIGTDLSSVSRPRKTPLLTAFDINGSNKAVWTTYGAGQIDLNFSNPEVLIEIINVADMLLAHGVAALRLDAVAFIWKRIGTSCVNQPEAAEVVNLIRTALSQAGQPPFLITETDASSGAEDFKRVADLTYRYDFAPCLVHSIATETTVALMRWFRSVSETGPYKFITFMSTHDGLYLRPSSPPLLSQELKDLERLALRVGSVPVFQAHLDRNIYEIAGPVHRLFSEQKSQRSRQIELAMFLLASVPGTPMVYLNTLLDAPAEESFLGAGPRGLNRRVYKHSELEGPTVDKTMRESILSIFSARRNEPALHRDSSIDVFHEDAFTLGFVRSRGKRKIYVVANLSKSYPAAIRIPCRAIDIQNEASVIDTVFLPPLGHAWLLAC